jgi:hypothetical protein
VKLLCIGGPKHGKSYEMPTGACYAGFPHWAHPLAQVTYNRETIQTTTDDGVTVIYQVLVYDKDLPE